MLNRNKLLFKTGHIPDLKKYVGRDIVVERDGLGPLIQPKKIIIEKIVGNIFKPQFYEINDRYLIGMLRFHARMLKDTSITEDQFQDFENMDIAAKKLEDNNESTH